MGPLPDGTKVCICNIHVFVNVLYVQYLLMYLLHLVTFWYLNVSFPNHGCHGCHDFEARTCHRGSGEKGQRTDREGSRQGQERDLPQHAAAPVAVGEELGSTVAILRAVSYLTCITVLLACHKWIYVVTQPLQCLLGKFLLTTNIGRLPPLNRQPMVRTAKQYGCIRAAMTAGGFFRIKNLPGGMTWAMHRKELWLVISCDIALV